MKRWLVTVHIESDKGVTVFAENEAEAEKVVAAKLARGGVNFISDNSCVIFGVRSYQESAELTGILPF